MKNSIKIIILAALSLLIVTGIILGVLTVAEVYTLEEALDNFLKALYVILITTVGLSFVAFVTSLFKN
jgi:hypothetical protein